VAETQKQATGNQPARTAEFCPPAKIRDCLRKARVNARETDSQSRGGNQTKSNQIKPNQTKSNQIKPNQTKSNQIKPNQTSFCGFARRNLVRLAKSGSLPAQSARQFSGNSAIQPDPSKSNHYVRAAVAPF
jgi:hypothetical protein